MLLKGLSSRVSSSLTLKLMVPLVAVAVIIGLVFGVVTLKYNSAYLIRVTEAMQKQTLTAQQSSVSILMKSYYNVFFSLAVDKEMRQLIDQYDAGLSVELVNQQAGALIKPYVTMDSNVISVHFVSLKGNLFGYNRSSDSISKIWDQGNEERLDKILNECVQSKGVKFFADERTVAPYGVNMFHMAIQLWDYYKNASDGFLIMTVSTRDLDRALATKNDSGIETGQSAVIINNGDYITHSDTGRIGMNIHDEKLDGGYMDVRYADTGSYNVRIVNIYDRRKMMSTVIFYNRMMMLTVFIILLVYLSITINLLIKAYTSVKRILKGIGEVEKGKLTVTIKTAGNDELARISKAFNKMVLSLKDINEHREKENSEKLKALDMQREAEILAMESQINTHFLANTINMISCTAIEQGNHQVAKLLKALATCMRYTFDKSGSPLTVRNELKQLDYYLMLQKERCGKQFDYIIRADADVLDEYIRKLVIQPFVENSILHGFAHRKSGGLLEICVRRFRKKKLAISVYDNGCGMPKQQLEAIRALFGSNWHPENMGIGIENVVYRIRRYYKDAWLYIRSNYSMGTKINIVLPRLEGVQAGLGPHSIGD